MEFNIKKQGNYFVAYDITDKKRSYGKINLNTGKFIGDTRCLEILTGRRYEYIDNLNLDVIDEIRKDLESGDLSALDELLNFIPINNRLGYLREI